MSFANRVISVLCVLFADYEKYGVFGIFEKYVIYGNSVLFVVAVLFVIYAIYTGAALADTAYVVESGHL